MKFKNNGGDHVEAGVTYKKGDVFESDRQMDKIFLHKFERVYDEAPKQLKLGKKKGKAKKTPEKPQSPSDKRGVDVTDQFEGFEEDGYKVFRRGTKFHIYEGDSTDPVNDKGLKKVDVSDFFDEDDEEDSEE
jgi:hypothetical protein